MERRNGMAHQAAPLRGKPTPATSTILHEDWLSELCGGRDCLSFLIDWLVKEEAAPAAGGWWGVLRNAKGRQAHAAPSIFSKRRLIGRAKREKQFN